MLAVLVKEGFDLDKLLWDYPIDLVLNLHQSVILNQAERRFEALQDQAFTLSLAVLDALDKAFNRGKERILVKWLDGITKARDKSEGKKRKEIPAGTVNYFDGMPVVVRKKGEVSHG
jgi:hypothetical protein